MQGIFLRGGNVGEWKITVEKNKESHLFGFGFPRIRSTLIEFLAPDRRAASGETVPLPLIRQSTSVEKYR